MLKLNKNSRNMCCALAVAAVFFIIVKCMQSEGFKGMAVPNGFTRRDNDECQTHNSITSCTYDGGKWIVVPGYKIDERPNGSKSKAFKVHKGTTKRCKEICLNEKKCAGFEQSRTSGKCFFKTSNNMSGKMQPKKSNRSIYVKK